MSAPITLSNLTLEWPDGTIALDGLDATFGAGRTGLVGDNGAGKSTLLKLIAGELVPTRGTISVAAEVGYLPQTLTWTHDASLAELLGISTKVAALHAVEDGDASEENLDTVGDDWDIESRAARTLASVGLDDSSLERRVGEISGGEAMLAAIAGLRLRGCPITLLDEPTNNLDRDARGRLRELVRAWKGTLVVVSHDIALLNEMDDTAELQAASLTTYGGPYDQWRDHLQGQQAAAVQALRSAEQAVRVEKRQRTQAETTLARRARNARTARADKVGSKIVMNGRASDAQNSAAKLRAGLDSRLEAARDAAAAAASQFTVTVPTKWIVPLPRM